MQNFRNDFQFLVKKINALGIIETECKIKDGNKFMAQVIAIVGPTAVGKTALSLELAQRLNGEIISGDSMQIYRHLDIGTAKATPAEQAVAPHYLIDIKAPHERFSVAEFKELAQAKIDEIVSRGKQPIIVGGTGFYLQALMENLSLGNDQFDAESEAIRQRLRDQLAATSPEAMWHQLQQVDPTAAAKIPVMNTRRVIRALEVIEKTGQLFSDQPQLAPRDDYYVVGLNTERSVLYDRINNRVDLMMEQGLLDEAKWIYDQGGMNWQSGKGIGYRELMPYFAGEVSLADAINQIKLDSRHYAKRQLTWFRNQVNTHWYDLVSGQNTTKEIEADLTSWLRK